MEDRITQLTLLLQEQPGDAFLMYCMALELAQSQGVTIGISHLTHLIAAQPDYLPSYYQLGQWLESIGKVNEAKVVYEQGINLATQLGKVKILGELKTALEGL